MKARNLGSLWMLVAAFFFACMGALVKLASQKFSSNEVVFYRSLFGLLVILAITRHGHKPLATPNAGRQIVRSLAGFGSLALFFYAIAHLPLAAAVTLNYTSPLFLALLSLFYLRREAKPVLITAVMIGFLGVALLLQPSFNGKDWLAAVLGLLSGMLAGLVYLQMTQLGRMGEPDWRTVFYFSLTCTVLSGLWMLVHEFHALHWRDLPLLMALGASATLAQLAMTRAYNKGNPLVVSSLSYSTVVLASLIGMLFWGENLSGWSWLGIGLIVLSGVISVRRTMAAVPAAPPALEKSPQAPTL
jgi:drug/metabolite transporter (DMT)-like permease